MLPAYMCAALLGHFDDVVTEGHQEALGKGGHKLCT